jgi:hypothetical protein
VRLELAVAALALAGACRRPPPAGDGSLRHAAPAGPVKTLAAHAGATALWHDGDLWVSTVRGQEAWTEPAPIRLSHGAGRIEQTLYGWVAGAHGGRAIVAVAHDDGIELVSDGTTGPPIILGGLPRALGGYLFGVTADGEAVALELGTPAQRPVRILAPGRARAFPILRADETVRAIDADPVRPRLTLALEGAHDRGSRARVVVLDTRSGRVLSEMTLGPEQAARMQDAHVLLDADGRLWLLERDGLRQLEPRGERTFLAGAHVDPRNIILARDGAAIAYTQELGGGDMGINDIVRACQVYFVRTTETATVLDDALSFRDHLCYYGLALAIVDGTLWVAPP